MNEDLHGLLAPAVLPLGLELVDVERKASSLRVVVNRPGGVDLDAIGAATRSVSAVLDEHDPFPGQRYTLEVSSPGIERTLRLPSHFVGAVGELVSVRTAHGGEGERRFKGRLTAADDDGFVLEGDDLPQGQKKFAYDDVQRARTVFEFGSAPSSPGKNGAAMRGRGSESSNRKAKRKKVKTS